MTELLSNRSELPHFWFHEALFKPFDGILSSTSCSEDDKEQVNNENNKQVFLQCTIKISSVKLLLESKSGITRLRIFLNRMLGDRRLQPHPSIPIPSPKFLSCFQRSSVGYLGGDRLGNSKLPYQRTQHSHPAGARGCTSRSGYFNHFSNSSPKITSAMFLN